MPTFVPQYNPSKVLTGLAAVYLQPYVPGTPPALPADTVALGTAWTTPWVPVGASANGASLDFQRATDTIEVEEQMTPVDYRTKSLTMTVNIELAEDDLQTMQWAFGGGTITTTAASTGVAGTSTLVIADEMSTFGLGMEAQNSNGFWRRILVPQVKSVAQIKTAYRRSNAPRTYSVSFESIVQPSQITIKTMDTAAL